MTATGRIEDLGLAEILYLVGASRRSAELLVDAQGRSLRVLFREGRIIGIRHPRGPASLEDFLVKSGVASATHLAVLAREAALTGKSLREALEADGTLRPGGLEQELEQEIDRLVTSALEIREGSFLFRLVPDVSALAGSYANLVLDRGIEPARIAAVSRAHERDGVHVMRLTLPRNPSARQATLVVPEESLRLPSLGAVAGSQSDIDTALQTAQDMTETQVAPAIAPPERFAVVSLPPGPLRDDVMSVAAIRGLEIRSADHWSDAEQLVRGASGREMAILAHASHAVVPGLELLAFSRTIDRTVPVVLLVEGEAPPGRRAVVADRAARLGVRHLVVLPADGHGAGHVDVRGIALHLVALLESATSPGEHEATPIALLAPVPGGPDLLAELVESAPSTAEPASLAVVARSLLPSLEFGDVARVILDVAGDYFPRAILLVKLKDSLRGIGGFGGSGAATADLLKGLVLPLDGEDFVSRAVRDGRAVVGPPTYASADRGVVSRLGRARHVALLPLSVGGACFGALHADDGGTGAPPADITALTTFLGEVAGPLHGALSAAQRRAEARRSRLPA